MRVRYARTRSRLVVLPEARAFWSWGIVTVCRSSPASDGRHSLAGTAAAVTVVPPAIVMPARTTNEASSLVPDLAIPEPFAQGGPIPTHGYFAVSGLQLGLVSGRMPAVWRDV